MVEHSQAVIKAIDFTLYSCSGLTCFLSYINHNSTLIALGIAFCSLLVSLVYKHLNYRNEKNKFS
jgi:hypothetical protein